ncbi:uncharacterized protein LOC111250361 isoform X3 [Varroa destructor]|uniref:Cuticlin-1 n=1 Tax=Varroa destructor TaxID=109461 RepID=A0A7M7K460_VARDE|nr:uncharacterized protein LOC111250361 isoform X3 [Varroa destructor]
MTKYTFKITLLPSPAAAAAAARSFTATSDSVCPSGGESFELVTGYVYTAPTETIELKAGVLQLQQCLQMCRDHNACRSVNFETGLCVLFSSSASERPESLSPSQFPVFTIYAEKVCIQDSGCVRDWHYERVKGYVLMAEIKKIQTVSSRQQCIELCFTEADFQCRSANFEDVTGQCSLSDMDRHTVLDKRLFQADVNETIDYLESNCVVEDARLCEFKNVKNKILKTVDAVYQDVKGEDECKKICLGANFRCHSYDMGDPQNPVCRISHYARASLTHIQDPYLKIAEAVTYELASCFNVSIECLSREMVARVKSTKMFNGKLYSKSKPNSCVTDVSNSMEFEITMNYHELECDVKQEDGHFFSDIVIQHHDMIVTNQDLGLSINCHYDLSNRSVSNGVQLEVDGREIEHSESQLATVGSPNVTMHITDRNGQDVTAAQVGDPLALRFQITDVDSPYEIFVRELVAMDGVDNSEILLIDSNGCPTDRTIMGPLYKVNSSGQVLHAPFDAFKFPTSEIVQFKALVTPCIPYCEPAKCEDTINVPFEGRTESDSYGRRRRRSIRQSRNSTTGTDEELVVVQQIRISDKFTFNPDEDKDVTLADTSGSSTNFAPVSGCANLVSIAVVCGSFLIAQVTLLFVCAFVVNSRRGKKLDELVERTPSVSSTASRLYSRQPFNTQWS